MSLIEQVRDVMSDHRGGAHVDDIADMLVERFPNIHIPIDQLPNKIANVLSSDTRKKAKAAFVRVKKQEW